MPSSSFPPFSQTSFWVWSSEGCSQRHPHPSPSAYEVRRFRRVFSQPPGSRFLRLHISADTRYVAWLDGKLIGRGPAPGDVRHQFYDTHCIDLPEEGPSFHVLAILVVDYSPSQCDPPRIGAPSAFMTRHGGLAVELRRADAPPEEAPLLVSDKSWRVQVDRARRFQPGKADWFGGFMGHFEEFVAAEDHAADWLRADCDDSSWENAAEMYPAERREEITDPMSPYGLLARETPFQEILPAIFPIGILAPGGGDAGTVWRNFIEKGEHLHLPRFSETEVILELDHEWTGIPLLAFAGGNGAEIRVGYSEALRISLEVKDAVIFGRNTDKTDVAMGVLREETGWTYDRRGRFEGYEDILRPDGRSWKWEPHHWRAAKFIRLAIRVGEEPLQLQSFSFSPVLHPLSVAEPFRCSDLRWEQLQETNLRTLRLCLQETFIDCPYYEQLQYIGDSALNCEAAMLAGGAYALTRQLILHFDWSRTPEGWTQSRYPSRNEQVIPSQSLDWIAAIHAYGLHSGDLETVGVVWRGAREVLETYASCCNADGLPEHLPYWNWVDWSPGWKRGVPPGGDEGPVLAHAAKLGVALAQASDIARWLRDAKTAAWIRRTRASLSRAAETVFWNGQFFADSPRHPKNGSRLGNALAVLAGFLPDAQKQCMAQILGGASLTDCSFFGRYFVRQALWELGACDFEKELAPWWDMQAMGLSTWAEDTTFWRSLCHGWSANPAVDIYTRVLGIRPTSPGFATARIEPAVSLFAKAGGAAVTPLGPLRIAWDLDANLIETVVPPGVRATLRLPGGLPRKLGSGRRIQPIFPKSGPSTSRQLSRRKAADQ